MLGDFFSHIDSLKVICLLMSALVLFVAIYRWLLIRWQADVNLKRYAFIRALPSKVMKSPFSLWMEIPDPQQVDLSFSMNGEPHTLFYSGLLEEGVHEIPVPTESMLNGSYELIMKCEGQEDLKYFDWEGTQLS